MRRDLRVEVLLVLRLQLAGQQESLARAAGGVDGEVRFFAWNANRSTRMPFPTVAT
ncbi:MAG: hypothetical protein ACYTGK_19340 [Planctomycetota bacterium]